MSDDLHHVVEAGKWARAKFSNADGSPLTEEQNAAILHAQVKAIVDGKFDQPEEAPSETKQEAKNDPAV